MPDADRLAPDKLSPPIHNHWNQTRGFIILGEWLFQQVKYRYPG